MTTDTERTTRRRDRVQLGALFAAVAVAAVLAVFIAAFGFAVLRGYFGDESPGSAPFDAQAWHDPDKRDMRRRMAIGLVEDKRLAQLPQAEVSDLLGEPRVDLSWWSYYVGSYLGGEYRLIVRFDDGGSVTDAEVRKFTH